MTRILAFAREAGGAAAIAPVLHELVAREPVLILAKDYAQSVFRAEGLPAVSFETFEPAAVEALSARYLAARWPDVLFTSASSLPALDMTDKYLWGWARQHHVPSVAVLDQWQNYALRFSGPDPAERLQYLPDWIAAMDEHARDGLVAAGIPADSIVVTGQPAFDRLLHLRRADRPGAREHVRRAVGVRKEARLVCFVAEAFAEHFGQTLGFTEQSVLRDLVSICDELVRTQRLNIHLAVKLHPQNDPAAFDWLTHLPLPSGMAATLHWDDPPAHPLVLASDVVVGMSSILLIESILLGLPTVSFQPNAREETGLMATVIGAIPLLRTRDTCLTIVRELLTNPMVRAGYLKQQERVSTHGTAAKGVSDLLYRASGRTVSDGTDVLDTVIQR